MTAPKDPADPRQKTIRRLRIGALLVTIVGAGIVANGMMVRMQARAEQETSAVAQSIPTVSVVRAKADATGNVLTLPGNLQAWNSAPIYARVPGYVTKWYKDIGAVVRKGDVLADIDTPELVVAPAEDQLPGVRTCCARRL